MIDARAEAFEYDFAHEACEREDVAEDEPEVRLVRDGDLAEVREAEFFLYT